MKNLIKRLLTATANDSGKAGWKLDADGKIEMKDGNPIYVNTNGQEMTVGVNKISELNAESRSHRERAEAAEQKLKAFDGIDPEKAKKAIDTVANIDAKKLIDSGEVEKVKDNIKKEFEGQLAEKDKLNNDLQTRINNMEVNSVFKDSEFVREQIAVPRDMFEDSFRKNFKVGQDGKVEAYGKDGNRVMSKERVGEYATPDEALRILVEQHPQKDTILKANPGSGSNNQGNGGSAGKGRTMKRSEFDKLTPVQKSETSQKMAKGEITISD